MGCNPGQLPTAVNLHIQCDIKRSLCGCARNITAHILSGCPVPLSQEWSTLSSPTLHGFWNFSELLMQPKSFWIYAALPGLRAIVSFCNSIHPVDSSARFK